MEDPVDKPSSEEPVIPYHSKAPANYVNQSLRSARLWFGMLAVIGWTAGSFWVFAVIWQLLFLPEINGAQVFVSVCELALAGSCYWFGWSNTRRAAEVRG